MKFNSAWHWFNNNVNYVTNDLKNKSKDSMTFYDMGSWKPSPLKTRACLSYIMNTVGAHALVTQEVDPIINSLRPSDPYIHQVTRPSLVQIMACCLHGTKPLSEPMLGYFLLDPWEQTSMKFQSKFIHFHSRKYISKCHLQNGSHFVSFSMCSCKDSVKITLQYVFVWCHNNAADWSTACNNGETNITMTS